jgi:hypothetical protein
MPPRGKCSTCDGVIGEKEVLFKCAFCNHQCHAKCDKRYFDVKDRIADVTYQHFEKMGFRWFCQKCISDVSNPQNEESVIVKEIKNLCERVNNVEKLLSPNNQPSTYASIAKGVPEKTLVITHSDPKVTGKKIAKLMSQDISPVSSKVSAFYVRDHKCIMKTKLDDKGIGELSRVIEAKLVRIGKGGGEAKPLKDRKPRLKIIGNFIDEELTYDKETIEDYIVKQNNFFQDKKEIQIVKFTKANQGKPDMLIIETSIRAYNAILKEGSIIINYTRCKVYDANIVPRCYKCARLGHFEKHCTSKSTCCPKCAGSHRLKDCKSNNMKCINCVSSNENSKRQIDVSHAAFDRACLTSVHRTNVLRSFFNVDNG